MKKIALYFGVFIVFAQSYLLLAGRHDISRSDNWVLLGTRSVDYLIDHDIIPFIENKNGYKAIKFIVKNGPLNMLKCTLHFKNGETKNVPFPNDVKKNEERIVDLKGSYLPIDKVTFWYDSQMGGDRKAIIEVWGNE